MRRRRRWKGRLQPYIVYSGHYEDLPVAEKVRECMSYWCIPISEENRFYYSEVLDWVLAHPVIGERARRFHDWPGEMPREFRNEIIFQVLEKAMETMRYHYNCRYSTSAGIRSLSETWVGGELPAEPKRRKTVAPRRRPVAGMDFTSESRRCQTTRTTVVWQQ